MDSVSPQAHDQSADTSPSGQWEAPPVDDNGPDPHEQPSPPDDNETDSAQKPSGVPMQKRRRVTRACDECRRKKIKCDGKQPCTHCTVYSYECTYDQPSNRRRNAAPQYIEALETQLKRAKALLSFVFPNVDLSDPNLDLHLQNGILPPAAMDLVPSQQNVAAARPPVAARRDQVAREEQNDSSLESMVRATGQLELDEDGNWDYHGHSSGVSFMKRLKEQFGDFIGPVPGAFVKYRPLSQVLDSPRSNVDSPSNSNLALSEVDLPSRKEAKILCEYALDAGQLVRVVHIPSFYRSVDRIYDTPIENFGPTENTFLPLLYSVLALGTLFARNGVESSEGGYETAIEEGFKYFKSCRQLLDISDCRDITSLQAILFMIQFLQSSAKLSTCYAYIGVAQRSALRMGLHRSFNKNFNPIEAETRKRVFWVIRKTDIYVGAMLGLPHFLGDEDIDQELPAEVEDECISETGIRPMPEGVISVMAGANAHTKLVNILAKIVKYIYPIKGTQSGGTNSVSYTVNYSKIRELEQDLQTWLEGLPMELKPGGEVSRTMIKVQQLLRMAFGHAQLLLYRPFLHYVSQSYQTKATDQRAFACASACVSVSRNIIHITAEMRKRGLLVGAYWFTMYTTFFAIISIIYFVLENPNNPTSSELLRDAIQGKEALAYFAKMSMAADRCTTTLKTVFDRLPDQIKRGGDFAGTRKRGPDGSPQSIAARPTFSRDPEMMEGTLRRASTFPEAIPTTKRTSFAQALPTVPPQYAAFGRDSPYQSSGSQRNSDFFDHVPTPTSTTPSTLGFSGLPNPTPIHGPAPQSFPPSPLTGGFVDPTGLNIPVSDVSAMMFPSADPFAYPNQPMTTFENSNPQNYRARNVSNNFAFQANPTPMDIKPHPSMFSGANIRNPSVAEGGGPTVRGSGYPADNDVQLFGPVPMYLVQGGQLGAAPPNQAFPGPQSPPTAPFVSTENTRVNFDDLFGGEEWANTFMDQGIGFGVGGPVNMGGQFR